MPRIEDCTVFITGASRGIGRAIAERFLAAGARVAGTRTEDVAREPTPTGTDAQKETEFFRADFSKLEDIRACADFVRELSPDILINNAGINKIAPFLEVAQDDFQRIQQVNVFAPFVLMQAAARGMKARGWGRIVSLSSIWGKISKEYRAAYSASKFALDGMTLALAAELSADGVLANCVAPGFTDTELTRRVLTPEQIDAIVQNVPARRMGLPAEIANLVYWLGSPENSYVTGQNFAIDGGFSRV
jgi:3-oxoacyl-[acyl-carrier protein] reductase